MKISRELKTGIIAIIILAVSVWGFNYLKGLNLFDKPPRIFYVEYNNVQGLNSASKVTINGLQVGRVLDISFNNATDKKGKLIVKFGVTSDFEFSKQSIAKIYSESLMGGQALAIVPSFEGKIAIDGDYLRGEVESDIFSSVGEKLNPLQAKLENVIVHVDSLLLGVNDILDSSSRRHIKNSIADLDVTMSNIRSLTDSINAVMIDNKQNMESSLRNVTKITSNFEKISDSLTRVDMIGTIEDLRTTINKFNDLATSIDNGEGTVGKLMKDEGLYNNLEQSAKELELLLIDFKEHPKRYVNVSVFGKKDKTGYVRPVEEQAQDSISQ